MKEIFYCAGSEKDIQAFPKKARERILRLLDVLRMGLGLHPKEFKYMGVVGSGVYELRVSVGEQYRVFYLTKMETAIYILHAFSKKTQKTSRADIEKGRVRLKQLLEYKRGLKNE